MSNDTLESLLRIPVHYDSFLLRIWHTAVGNDWHWMLENVATGERHTFTELPELVIFLRDHARKNEHVPTRNYGLDPCPQRTSVV